MMNKLRKAARAIAYARDRRALLNGVGASLEHAKVLRRLPAAGTIIDIGSNKGQFVLEAIKWHPNCQIFAFEPLTRERAVLERVLAGLPSLTVYPFALGEQEATTQMHVSSAADHSNVRPSVLFRAARTNPTRIPSHQMVTFCRLIGSITSSDSRI